MDVVLHPRFAENKFVYLSYTKPLTETQSTLALARARWNGTELTELTELFVAGPGTGGASRLAFGLDGTLYMTTGGGGGNGAQDPNSQAGKVLRLRDDGGVPPTIRSSGAPATSRRSIPSAIAIRSGWPCIPATGEHVAERERPERRRRDQHLQARARTTAGRS